MGVMSLFLVVSGHPTKVAVRTKEDGRDTSIASCVVFAALHAMVTVLPGGDKCALYFAGWTLEAMVLLRSVVIFAARFFF